MASATISGNVFTVACPSSAIPNFCPGGCAHHCDIFGKARVFSQVLWDDDPALLVPFLPPRHLHKKKRLSIRDLERGSSKLLIQLVPLFQRVNKQTLIQALVMIKRSPRSSLSRAGEIDSAFASGYAYSANQHFPTS